jgi:hypothetical protein
MQVDTPFINNVGYMHPKAVNEYVMSSRKTQVDEGKDGDTNNSGMGSTLPLLLLRMMMMMTTTTIFPITQNCRKFKGFKQIFTYRD